MLLDSGLRASCPALKASGIFGNSFWRLSVPVAGLWEEGNDKLRDASHLTDDIGGLEPRDCQGQRPTCMARIVSAKTLGVHV